MNTLKILILLLVMGAYQAGATGFSHNMNQAQKMLKTKKEAVVKRKAPATEQQGKKHESKAAEADSRYSDKAVTIRETEEHLSERAVGTFVQWLSNLFLKLLGGGVGR